MDEQRNSNWLDTFQQQGKPPTYPSKPDSVVDQIEAMPNSEKLSPTEKWIYEKLPGFSQSSVGKALASFGESPAGKILAKLDIAAEGLERTLGVVAQWRDLPAGEDMSWKDAWTAGSLYYDTVKMPKIKYNAEGKAVGLEIDSDAPGAYALTEARRLLENGKTLDEVRDTLYGNMGALALRAQLKDTLGHIALDPFNWAFAAVKPVERIQAIRHLAMTGKMDVQTVSKLEQAARLAGNIQEADKLAEAITKAEQSGKAMTRFERFAIAITGGTPWLDDTTKASNAKNLLWRLNPFALTPQAKASELLDMVAANVGEYLIRPMWNAEPEEMLKSLSAAARGSIGGEWGHLAMSIEGRTVQGILSNADGAAKALGVEWKTYNTERRLLGAIAGGIPGTDERKIWQLAKKSPKALMEKITQAAKMPGNELLLEGLQSGAITEETLTTIGKMSNNIPLLKEEFYAKMLVTVQDVAMKQAIVQFGIKEKGVLTKWSDALKAWESLPFIKANPANAMRNLVNNDVTLIGRGLFGTMTDKSINALWKGEWIPPQFHRAFGFSTEASDEIGNMAFDSGSAIKAMEQVLEGSGGAAQAVEKAARKVDLGVFDFSKWSQQFEKKASMRASTTAWLEFHQKYWNPRTGYTSISKSLDANTLQQLETLAPGITKTLDNVAQASGSDARKFSELMQSNIEHNVAGIFKSASDNLGYKVDDVLGTEVVHAIQDGLPQAIKDGKVPEFIAGVKLQMEQHVDDMFTKHLENLPGIVAGQVQAGGQLQFHRIFGKAMDEFWGGNVEHAARMSTISEAIDYARSTGDYKKVSSLWKQISADSDAHFGRIWKKFDAYQEGMKKGAELAGIPFPAQIESSFGDIRKGWDDFFSFRKSEYERVFSSDMSKNDVMKEFEKIQGEIDKRYSAMIQEEDRLMQSVDDLMVDALPDPVQQSFYKNYRDTAAQLRVADRTKTAEFFKRIRKAAKEDAPDMWQQYWTERMARLEQMRQVDMRGSAALQGDSDSIGMFINKSQGSGKEPQNVFELASQYGIPSATKNGARNDRRVLSTVNKYAKEAGVTDAQIVANAKLPDEVKSAFNAWDEARNTLKEVETQDIADLAQKQELLKSAKEAEKLARTGYEETLKTNKIDKKLVDKLIAKREFMDASTIPMDVAKSAFEARGGQRVENVAESMKRFIPDAEKMLPDPMPIETALSEMNYGRGYSAIDAILEQAMSTSSKKSKLIADLPEELQQKVMQWSKQVNGEMSSFRSAGVQYSAFRRDSALLNYNRRTNFDSWVGNFAPFAFWTTHSVANWAIHSLDRPAMMSTYFRMRQFMETAGLQDQNVPSRLKGNIRVNLPFTPDWMGDTFINPTRFLLPFDGFMMPWEQKQQSKFSTEGKVKDTLGQMLEQGQISEDEYNDAVESQSGDAWDIAMQTVKEGGDNYDAMDFVSMTMTPHAPLMWAYNAAKGTPQDIGAFTPMTRTAKNFATMMGVDDWSNHPYNIEGRIRKSMGLPAFDKWDDYRVGRSISNIATEGRYDMEEVKEAMQVAAMVEAGKMDSKDAVKQNKLYAEATKRANQEAAGGWAGTILSVLGIPVRAYPEGEQEQRELAEQFSAAYQEYDAGNVEALTDFFDKHPEYEARLALFKKPEERLQNFMIDNMWARWNELPKVNQDELKEQLGNEFADKFLSRETQNYDSISPLQLQVWLKLAGGKPVGTLTADQEVMIQLGQLKFTDPETAWRVETFYDMRNNEHPEWYTLQNKYYALPEKQRKEFAAKNPELREYWDDRRRWMTQNPDLVRFLTDDPKQLAKYANTKRVPQVAVPTAQEIQSQMSPEMISLVQDWQSGEPLPSSMDNYIKTMAQQYGMTEKTLLGILTSGQ